MTALNLAANVVQFVDFSLKLISKGNAFSQPWRTEFSNAIAELKRCEEIMQSVNLVLIKDNLSENNSMLLHLTKQYVSLAEELRGILEDVSSSPKPGTWKSFRQAIKSSRYKNKIADLERRISRLREDISFLIIVQSNRQMGIGLESSKNAEASIDPLITTVFSSIKIDSGKGRKRQTSHWSDIKSLDPPDYETLKSSDPSIRELQVKETHWNTVGTAAIYLVRVLLGDIRLRRLLLSAIARIGKVAFKEKLETLFYEVSTLPLPDQGTAWLMKHQPDLLANLVSDELIPLTIEDMRKQSDPDFDPEPDDSVYRLRWGHAIDSSKFPDDILRHLCDLKAIENSFHSSEIISWLYDSFQRHFFPSPKELISEVLSQHLLDEAPNEVSCHIEWQLVEYLRQEFPSKSSFDEVFTITGELNKAWGTSVREYMTKTWPTGSGTMVWDALQKILLHQSFNKGMSDKSFL